MTKFDSIKKDTEALSAEERKKLRDWLDELDAQAWDEQIDRDAKAGKLDWLAEEALSDYRAGRTRKLPGTRSK